MGHFVHCCLLLSVDVMVLSVVKTGEHLALTSTCFDGFQPKLGHRCNMGTLICWWGQRLHIKVKGHQRSSCKVGWKCESGLIWKVEVWLEPNLVYRYNMGTFIYSCSQRSYTKVRGHLRWSCKLKSNLNQTWFIEPSYVYAIKRSQIKVKGNLRSAYKITWKCKFGTYLHTWGPIRITITGVGF